MVELPMVKIEIFLVVKADKILVTEILKHCIVKMNLFANFVDEKNKRNTITISQYYKK